MNEFATNLNTKEASLYLQKLGLRFTPKTLEIWRCEKKGPAYKKIGGRIFYTQPALLEFSRGTELSEFPQWEKFDPKEFPFCIVPHDRILDVIVYSLQRGVEMATWRYGNTLYSHSGANLNGRATHYMMPPNAP